ncbi:MAG: hypothetical protein M3Q17_05175, partial [Actinomycetota bacterium]|nr:hypothetical protein [Actinomycetota bacterium]
ELRFRPWPEGDSLTRMAAAVPEDVAAVYERVGDTDNPSVARLVASAAARMPAQAAARLRVTCAPTSNSRFGRTSSPLMWLQ